MSMSNWLTHAEKCNGVSTSSTYKGMFASEKFRCLFPCGMFRVLLLECTMMAHALM